MTDVIGKGVIEVSADATKLKAGMDEANRSIRGFGDNAKTASKSASDSIDRYVKRLETQAATQGKTTRETELYKLALRGANTEQIKAADSALKLADAYAKGEVIGARIRAGLLAIGTAAAVGTIAAYVAFDQLIKKAAQFQHLSETTGASAVGLASIAVAAATAGVSMESVAGSTIKLTKNLTGVDDESKAAGSALVALGINVADFKKLDPVGQFDAVGKALSGFADGAGKTAVAVALYGKAGAEQLKVFKAVEDQGGRQVILTAEQIRQADDYADKQAKLHAEISLHAQVIAIKLLPTIIEYKQRIADLAKDQELMAIGTSAFNTTLSVLAFTFKAIVVLAASTGAAFSVLGKSIAGYVSVSEALLRLDFKGAKAIGEAFREDAGKNFTDTENLKRKLFADKPADKFADPRVLGNPGSIAEQTKNFKPEVKFNGAIKDVKGGKGGKDTIAQEAKAQLAFDIDNIKKAAEASLGTIANTQRILEANRAAALKEEGEYYAERLALLNRNTAAQEGALVQEIARFQAERLQGKDKIDNDRKILDAQAKLARVREDAAASVQVLQIQETAALKAIAQQYRDAEDAANDFLNTIRKTQARDLAGAGIGQQARDRTAGRAQIEDKFSDQRRALDKSRRDAELNGSFGPEAQKKYDDELARIRRFQATALGEYDSYFSQRIAQEKNFANGANEAFANYLTEVENTAGQTQELFTSAFKGAEDALTNFVTSGKLSFSSLADSIVHDITRMIVKQNITGPIAKSLQGGFGSGEGVGGSIASFLGGLFGGGRASGGPVQAGGLYQVNERGPELLSVAGRQYLMMGSQAGSVTPNGGSGGGNMPTRSITLVYHAAQGESRATATQRMAEGARALQLADSRNN